MKLVVDTNIVFSALLNQGNSLAEVLLNPRSRFQFYAPSLLATELNRHRLKLAKLSSLTPKALAEATDIIMGRISLISENLIEDEVWLKASDLTRGVDEDDTPFVALAITLNTPLWTGDRKLASGLRDKGFQLVITTPEILSEP